MSLSEDRCDSKVPVITCILSAAAHPYARKMNCGENVRFFKLAAIPAALVIYQLLLMGQLFPISLNSNGLFGQDPAYHCRDYPLRVGAQSFSWRNTIKHTEFRTNRSRAVFSIHVACSTTGYCMRLVLSGASGASINQPLSLGTCLPNYPLNFFSSDASCYLSDTRGCTISCINLTDGCHCAFRVCKRSATL